MLDQEGVINEKLVNSPKKAVGFRNVAVHSYEAINWEIVHCIVKFQLVDFSDFAKIIAMRLNG